MRDLCLCVSNINQQKKIRLVDCCILFLMGSVAIPSVKSDALAPSTAPWGGLAVAATAE